MSAPRRKAVVRAVFDFHDGGAATALRAAAHGSHDVGVGITRRRSRFLAEQALHEIEHHSELRTFVVGIRHTRSYSNNESTNSLGSKGSRSPAFSPTPTKRTGNPNSRQIATTTPPLAVPSSFVRTIPVTPADCVNRRACCKPF